MTPWEIAATVWVALTALWTIRYCVRLWALTRAAEIEARRAEVPQK